MKLRFFFLALLLTAVACDEKPKISAQDMKRVLQADVFDFNRELNAVDLDAARVYVAPGAEPAFDRIIEDYKAGKYNFFQTNDVPEIDYLAGEARVVVRVFKGEHKQLAGAKEVGQQVHQWKYVNGTWQWFGPVSR